MSFTDFGLEYGKINKMTVRKVASKLRKCFVLITTITALNLFASNSLLGQETQKPVYRFEDARIAEADTLIAHKAYQEALEAYEDVLSTYTGESFYEGMVYATERMAVCYRRLRHDTLAVTTFQKAIKMAKEKLDPNHILLSKAYYSFGVFDYSTNKMHRAAAFLDSASVANRNSNHNDQLLTRKIIKFKFYSYYYARLNTDSLVHFLNQRQIHFNNYGNEFEEKTMLIWDYSRTYLAANDFEKSKAYALEGIKIYEANTGKRDHFMYSMLLFSMGKALNQKKELTEALEVCNRLIAYIRKNDSKSSEFRAVLNLKAVVLNGLNRFDESIALLKKNLELIVKRGNRETHFYRTSLMNLGVAYQRNGQYKKAKEKLFEALALEKLAGLKSHTITDNSLIPFPLFERYRYVGQLFSSRKMYEKAILYYDSALQERFNFIQGDRLLDQQIDDHKISMEVLTLLSDKSKALLRHYEKSNHSNIDTGEIAKEIIKLNDFLNVLLVKNRGRIENSDGKLLQTSRFKDSYETALQARYILDQKTAPIKSIQEVLRTLSQIKSLLLIEQITEYSILKNDLIPQLLRSELGMAISNLEDLDNQINELIAIDPLGDSVMILNSEKMKWNARLAEVKRTIERDYPEADEDFLDKDISLSSLRNDHQLTNKKALIEYFVGDSVIFVVGLSGDKESFHRIKKDRKLNEALSGFLGEVNTAPNLAELEAHLKNFGESALRLYQSLLKPVLDDLGAVDELIIVPDDILSKVPFEMLISDWSGNETSFKELNYLLKAVKVSHLLSSKVSFNELTQSRGKGLLGFGYVGDGIADERAEMGGLPGALKEINFLKSNFAGDFYMGKEGTKRQFLKKAGDYDVIHLALHGKSDSVNRYNSALVFNGDRDYYMTSTDLYRTRLKSRLAVLSACETGIGKISEGEGSFSIARGFAIAGVPAIVTTLWKVNDEAGATITQQFYRNLQSGNQKDEALRQAKLKYLEQSDNLTSSPFYWGSYILIGDTSTIELRGKAGLPVYWILAVLVALGLGLRRLSRKPFNQAA